jgi:hypothetical protein
MSYFLHHATHANRLRMLHMADDQCNATIASTPRNEVERMTFKKRERKKRDQLNNKKNGTTTTTTTITHHAPAFWLSSWYQMNSVAFENLASVASINWAGNGTNSSRATIAMDFACFCELLFRAFNKS